MLLVPGSNVEQKKKSFTTINLAVVNIEHKTSPRFLAEFFISQQSWKKASGTTREEGQKTRSL